MKSLFAVITLIIFAACVCSFGQNSPTHMTVNVDGVARHALVFTPSNPREKSPVIFGFHGHGGSPDACVRGMAFQKAWPEAIVVYPQGIPIPTGVDPQGEKPGWQREPGEVGNRDLKFVDALLTKLREQHQVDDERIFAVGFSNGAFFSYLLWVERPNVFAGFAPVAGLPRYSGNPKIPKPAVQIGGRADKLVHLADVEKAMAMVRELNGCPNQGQPCGNGCTRYSSTKSAPVVQAFHPGGHVYPPQATNLIVNFFKEIGSGGSTASEAPASTETAATEEPSEEEVEMSDETSGPAAEFARRAENVAFQSGAFTLQGWIYKPQGTGPFPAIVWNHGSEKKPGQHPPLGKFYTEHGYVLFLPIRHGHDGSPGPYIGDAIKEFKAHTQNKQAVQRKAVEFHEQYNTDVVAAIMWLKKQPYVDPHRIAVTGVSYGGIQTLLTAEKNLGLRAAIPFAPGAMSWSNKQLQQKEIEAVQNSKVPLFLLQAQNDYSIGPSQTLGPIIRSKGGANRAKLYPAFGTTHPEGHGGFACKPGGIEIWSNDVLAFLRATGM
jgi:polyhydroxybutyrate depolymerase